MRIPRKAVYVPTTLWDILAEDANRHVHSVAAELQNILLCLYSDRLPGKQDQVIFNPSTLKNNKYAQKDALLREKLKTTTQPTEDEVF
jgi:hypothetical protein